MTTEGKKGGVAALLPMMAGFFVMGFADIVGTVVNQVKSECALDDKPARSKVTVCPAGGLTDETAAAKCFIEGGNLKVRLARGT